MAFSLTLKTTVHFLSTNIMSGRGSDRIDSDSVEMDMQTDGNASGEDENYESPISPSQQESSLAE
ncbi:hypothetical protein CDAR_509691, partial [Caerostris darwini]